MMPLRPLAALLVVCACGATAAPTPAPSASPTTVAPTAAPTSAAGDLRIDALAGRSTVTVRVREQLANIQAPGDAVLTTSAVSGQLVLRPDGAFAEGSRIVVDLDTLRSNESRRDNFIKDNTLQTRRFPRSEFVLKRAEGLPAPLPTAGEWRARLVGDLTIRGVTRELAWDATVKRSSGDVSGTATTKFSFGDFGLERPVVASVLSIVDEIRLEIAFAGSAS